MVSCSEHDIYIHGGFSTSRRLQKGIPSSKRTDMGMIEAMENGPFTDDLPIKT